MPFSDKLASTVAARLRQTNLFTPHVDTGDFVIVINADKVRLTERNGCRRCISGTPATSAGKTTARTYGKAAESWSAEL
jgi:ribosomal protein L13